MRHRKAGRQTGKDRTDRTHCVDRMSGCDSGRCGNFWCDCRASDRSSLLFCSTGDCIAGSRTCRICSRGDRDRRRNRHSFSTCSTFDGRDWIDPDRAWSTGNIIYRKALHCNVSGDVSVYRETVPEAVSQKGGV